MMREDRPDDFKAWATDLFDTHRRDQVIDSLADSAEAAWSAHDQLRGAVEAVREHHDHWVEHNSNNAREMWPRDRKLWTAVLGPDAGGQ